MDFQILLQAIKRTFFLLNELSSPFFVFLRGIITTKIPIMTVAYLRISTEKQHLKINRRRSSVSPPGTTCTSTAG